MLRMTIGAMNASQIIVLAAPIFLLLIALMVAQAMGRATVLHTPGALLVAVDAGFFMLSDTLLALNKFVSPLWVLSTAQVLIVLGLLADTASGVQSSLTSTIFSDLAKIQATAKPTE